MVESNPNVPAAFGLVIMSGSATVLGGTVVFFPSLVKLASRRTLAGALGFSAGVMTYVSFVDILLESQESFEAAGYENNIARIYSGVCFFGGVLFMLIMNWIVTFFLGGHHHHETHLGSTQNDDDEEGQEKGAGNSSASDSEGFFPCPCHDHNPVQTLNKFHDMAQSMAIHPDQPHEHDEHHCGTFTKEPVPGEKTEEVAVEAKSGVEHCSYQHQHECSQGAKATNSLPPEETATTAVIGQVGPMGEARPEEVKTESSEQERLRKLMRMSINTVIAIALHNFPEGLAIFVSALNDPKIGAMLAIALAVHNVPLGLCVSMPIYYATGQRWKAFAWAALSGLAEPFAGFMGWIVLANAFSPTLFAILFGMVAGMMVTISLRELLPTAHRYDPQDSVVTYSLIGGMAVMALSLWMFALYEN